MRNAKELRALLEEEVLRCNNDAPYQGLDGRFSG